MERHLFVIWEKASYAKDRIINDIKSNLEIIQIAECSWTPNIAHKNFSRFYGTNLPINSFKERECGKGPFHIIFVLDQNPNYLERRTSKGLKVVNVNIFDLKEKYRSWTNGGSKIHATNDPVEFNHDITLLTGLNEIDYFRKYGQCNYRKIKQDIIGTTGWKSLKDLFYVLNNTVKYVILRGHEYITTNNNIHEDHLDIDILTSDYEDMSRIINGEPTCSISRPHQKISINDKTYYLDLWNTNRQYFDPRWSYSMLSTRIETDGVFTLNPYNDFYCLLYHCLINKNKIALDYAEKLNKYKKIYRLEEHTWQEILASFLNENDYDITKSDDESIGFHIEDHILKKYTEKNGKIIKAHFFEKEKTYSRIYERNNSYYKQGSSIIIDTEYQFLNQLTPYKFFPKIINKFNDSIEISKLPGKSLECIKKEMFILTIKQQRLFVIELIKILEILYKEQIIHRDITPGNILLSLEKDECKAFLIDFGWATTFDKSKTAVQPSGLGEHYRHPTYFSDAYALANVIQEVFPNSPYIQPIAKLLKNLSNQEFPTIDLLEPLKNFLNRNNFIYLSFFQFAYFFGGLKGNIDIYWKRFIFHLHFRKWLYFLMKKKFTSNKNYY